MYTKANADTFNAFVRKFFDGPEHAGAKSDNKKYDAAPAEGFTLKEGQADRRNANLAKAAEIRQSIHGKKQDVVQFKGSVTPAEMGEIISKQKLRGGNCAEMTWLCCYYFAAKNVNIWLSVVDDPGDHQFCILAKLKPDYKNIATMKYDKDDQWIIDPWANIVCKPGEFPAEFAKKMQKWTDKGKRIGVPVNGKYKWTPGIDPDYMKAITESNLQYKKGWQF